MLHLATGSPTAAASVTLHHPPLSPTPLQVHKSDGKGHSTMASSSSSPAPTPGRLSEAGMVELCGTTANPPVNHQVCEGYQWVGA
jgi:hypothetical protein